MIENLPLYISLLFVLTVLATIVWFYQASKSKAFLMLAVGWVALQTVLGLNGVYQNTQVMPPRLMLFGVFPTLVLIALTFVTTKGKAFIGGINLKTLTTLHTLRIPVEIVLALLSYHGFVSVLMTFEGTNFDIFSGITAPIIAFVAFRSSPENKKLLVAWNILCLLLLLNVVTTAVLALPSPLQKIAFDQPNVAVMFFPFNLLPTVVVPIVFFGHLVALKRLIARN